MLLFRIRNWFYYAAIAQSVWRLCYWLNGQGIESRWRWARFSLPVKTGHWDLHSLLYNGYRDFPRGKADGTWC
jgi:hypothetical protein